VTKPPDSPPPGQPRSQAPPPGRRPAPLTATYGGTGQNQRLSFGSTTYTSGIQGLLSATTGGASTYYERDPSGTLISERGPGGEFYYYTDGLGSTLGLIDTTGTVQATYTYDPYGVTTVGGPNPAIANGNPYRYAGGYYDTATGLYHFGQRYYNPTTGRWTQQDSRNTPLNPTNGNRYAYTGDDPINNTDPNGLSFLGIDCPFGNVNGGGSGCRGASEARQAAPILAAGASGALEGCGAGAVAGEIVAPEALGGLPGCALGAVGYANYAIIDAGIGGTGDVPPAPSGG